MLGLLLPQYGKPVSNTIRDLLAQEHNLDGNQFCNYVYRRYYFVKRLTTTMLLFLDVEDRINKNKYKKIQLDSLFDFNDTAQFKDMRIQRSVDGMQQKRSLKPLFMIWEEFHSYTSIKDQIFVEEFTKEVFIISRNMLITLAAHDEFVVVPPIRATATAEQLLNDIDFMTDMIYKLENNLPIDDLQAMQQHRDVDLHTFAHINDVMMRYYVIKRLKNACSHLPIIAYYNPRMSKNITWHHPLIVSCVHVMEQSRAVDPLIELWDDVLQYKYVQDDLFMHEFAQLVLVIYANAMNEYAQKNTSLTKNALSTAIAVYQVIDKLPLQEILDVIDIITHDLPPLLEKYEFDSDISWRAWFRKYWWAPPLIVASIVTHILLNWEAKKLLSEASLVVPPQKSSIVDDEGDEKWLALFSMPM